MEEIQLLDKLVLSRKIESTFHNPNNTEFLNSFEFGKGTPIEGIALEKPKASKPKPKKKEKKKNLLQLNLKKKVVKENHEEEHVGKMVAERKNLKSTICGIKEVKDM